MKKVYIEPAWKMHSYYKALADSPPPEYEFVTAESSLEKVTKAVSKIDFANPLFLGVDYILPLNLIKSNLTRFQRIPVAHDLIYAYDHLVLRKEPWVVDIEYVTFFVSYEPWHFQHFKGIIQKVLSSEYCKKIICGTEASQKTITHNLDCSGFKNKLEIVPFAIHKKNFCKKFSNNKIKLLFVGSSNILGQFEIKGGREALETFVLLSKKYDNLELVVRSDVPPDIKTKYADYKNINIIDRIVPWQIMEQEFKTADIFILPVHNTPFSVFLDAMSYELPVVTIDSWANGEIVEDGKTGLLAQKSDKIPYYVENFIPNFGTARFKKALKTPDPQVVQRLAGIMSILVENQELRRQMGKAGRKEVEHGRFSIERRSEKLKRIFDEATY
jgi:glycosyltransferase involved in cell wall biosynthesis